MGGFGCPICSERLDRLPAEAAQRNDGKQNQEEDVNISATPCGHIFHTYCINKWLTGSQSANNKQCPCCRKAVPSLRVLPLFPNGNDDSILDDSMSGGTCDHSSFNITIGSLRKQLVEEQEKSKEVELLLAVQRDSAADFKKKYDSEKLKSDHYLFQWKQYESYKDFANEKKKHCELLEVELQKYQMMDALVKGVNDEVEQQLECFPPTNESIRALLEIKEVLTGEVKSMSKKLDETKKDQEAVRIEKMKLRGKYEQLQKEFNELRKVYDNSLSHTPQTSRRIEFNNIQKNSRTPLFAPSTSTKKLFSQNQDESIDADVCLIQPFGRGGKKMLKKANSTNSVIEEVTLSSGSSEASQESTQSSQFGSTEEEQMKNKKAVTAKNAYANIRAESAPKKYKRDGGIFGSIAINKHEPIEDDDDNIPIRKKTTEWIDMTGKGDGATSSSSGSSEKSLRSASTVTKLTKLTKCDFAATTQNSHNNTIEISSDDDDTYSPMQLKGNIPGLKVTPINRAALKRSAQVPTLLKKALSTKAIPKTSKTTVSKQQSTRK